MATFPALLITPERVVLEEDVSSVILRTDEGDVAFLAGHTPLIGSLVPGLVRIAHEDGSEQRFEVTGGLVHVTPERVWVLVPEAEPAS
ncbi:MAG TPA: ATP synthase F1 subunit epsilon [Acidimicrobiales bacterium]|nr:ATP synthase F1 subunit epsilon [Acidimicrobiales bacterium]